MLGGALRSIGRGDDKKKIIKRQVVVLVTSQNSFQGSSARTKAADVLCVCVLHSLESGQRSWPDHNIPVGHLSVGSRRAALSLLEPVDQPNWYNKIDPSSRRTATCFSSSDCACQSVYLLHARQLFLSLSPARNFLPLLFLYAIIIYAIPSFLTSHVHGRFSVYDTLMFLYVPIIWDRLQYRPKQSWESIRKIHGRWCNRAVAPKVSAPMPVDHFPPLSFYTLTSGLGIAYVKDHEWAYSASFYTEYWENNISANAVNTKFSSVVDKIEDILNGQCATGDAHYAFFFSVFH